MNMRLRSLFAISALSVVLFPVLGSNAAADECAQNATSDPPGLSKSYNTLPILVWLHDDGSGTGQPKITKICFGTNAYSAGRRNPGDMKISATSATLRFRVAQDLSGTTKWKRDKSKARARGVPQPGISMLFFPNDQTPSIPGSADWVDCAGDVTLSSADISFDFTKCAAKSGTFQYELQLQQCQGGDCKDIPIDPQIINQPRGP